MRMQRTWRWWMVYATCVAAVFGALMWISLVLLDLERDQLLARAEAQQQEAIRLSLWRMDSFLAGHLAREAVRPYFEYLPYYPQERAYTRILNEIQPGDVLTPSPLLTSRSAFFPVHFQIDSHGVMSSPQVPTGNLRDLAESTVLTEEELERASKALGDLTSVLQLADLRSRVVAGEARLATLAGPAASEPESNRDRGTTAAPGGSPPPQAVQQRGSNQQQWLMSQAEAEQRARSYVQQTSPSLIDGSNAAGPPGSAKMQSNRAPAGGAAGNAADGRIEPDADAVMQKEQLQSQVENDAEEFSLPQVGPLVPLWMGADMNDAQLLFVRRVVLNESKELFQGFRGDWMVIRAALLEQIGDLLPEARLRPVAGSEAGLDEASVGRTLAGAPVRLECVPPAGVNVNGLSPARVTLGLAWIAVLLAAGAVAIMMQATMAYAEKRSRFASAVTHELRTPLTTFRMYSEMLAEGMIADEGQRQTYLQTLRDESARLAALVENVLAYARLEEGRAHSTTQLARRDHTTTAALIERHTATLARRAHDAGMTLITTIEPEAASARLTTDIEAVGQILFNLVDNSCKYAAGAENREIELRAKREGDRLVLKVSDHGPGVPSKLARQIFTAFQRGDRHPSVPGVGLGLALSRALARTLGGELRLEESKTGAAFSLRLSIDTA